MDVIKIWQLGLSVDILIFNFLPNSLINYLRYGKPTQR